MRLVWKFEMKMTIDRIEELLLSRGVSARKIKRTLAETCGITYEAVRQWFTGSTTNIEAKHLAAIANKYDSTLEWLISGKGEMNNDSVVNYLIEPGKVRVLKNIDDDIGESPFIDIPYYRETHLSAGNGSVVEIEEETDRLTFQRSWLQKMSLKPENLVVVRCKGDSMEPRIQDGDIVLINTQYHDIRNVEDRGVYAINYAGEAKIKRLVKRFDGNLVIRSDNPSPNYLDEIVTEELADQLKIIGKAVWVGGML